MEAQAVGVTTDGFLLSGQRYGSRHAISLKCCAEESQSLASSRAIALDCPVYRSNLSPSAAARPAKLVLRAGGSLTHPNINVQEVRVSILTSKSDRYHDRPRRCMAVVLLQPSGEASVHDR
jgi:hypothetical protein